MSLFQVPVLNGSFAYGLLRGMYLNRVLYYKNSIWLEHLLEEGAYWMEGTLT